MNSFTQEQLVDLAEGRLPPAEATALHARVAADPAARAELAAIEGLIALMRDDQSEDAPEYVIARALRLMRAPDAPSLPTVVRRVLAVLRADSRRAPLAAGLRSEQTTARSLTYSAEDCDLDLQIVPRAGRWQLRGQILGVDVGGIVELAGRERPVDAAINELGEFSLPPVEAGAYTLLVRLSSREILIEDLELGPSAAHP